MSRRAAPPALAPDEQAALKETAAQYPQVVGLVWTNWCWKSVQQFFAECFGLQMGRSCCIDWLHRLGFVHKRPGKRLLKADATQRTVFVAEYQTLGTLAQAEGARLFFIDEAHFRADVEAR